MSGHRRVLKPDCHFPPDGEADVKVPDGDPEFPNLCTTSIDIGTVNFAVEKVTLVVTPGSDGKEWRVILENASALTLKCGDAQAPIEAIVRNLFIKMNHPDLGWAWPGPNEDRDIIVERQVDQIRGIGQKDHHGKATMHAVYSALRMLELARGQTLLCMSAERLATHHIPADIVIDDMHRASSFVPVSGHKKAGLAGTHGDDRKQVTMEAAEAFLEKEGQEEALAWYNLLARHKPREDVADAYLQARRHLEDKHELRLKEKRKQVREFKRLEREAQKEVREFKRLEREAQKKKRKRERSQSSPSNKKQKRAHVDLTAS